MSKYEEIKKALAGMLSPEMEKVEIDKITAVSALVDEAEKENDTLQKKHDDLKNDYIEKVKSFSFRSEEDPAQEQSGGATLEDIANAIIKGEK